MTNDNEIECQFKEIMLGLAQGIDEVLNGEQCAKRIGFVLLVFPFEHHDGRCNYISNAERKDIVVLMKETIARFEGQPEMKGNA